MFRHLVVALLTLLASTSLAQQFHVDGTDVTLHVDAAILKGTPSWKPGENTIPVSAERAVAIAGDYHRKQELGGWAILCSWNFFRAILITEENDRCYWIISYKGVFGEAKPTGTFGGGYSYTGPKLRYIHYPVLMNGKVAPARPPIPPSFKTHVPVNGTEVQQAGWPQLSERELVPYRRTDDDPFGDLD